MRITYTVGGDTMGVTAVKWGPLSGLLESDLGVSACPYPGRISPTEMPVLHLASFLFRKKIRPAGVEWSDFVGIPAAVCDLHNKVGKPTFELRIYDRLIHTPSPRIEDAIVERVSCALYWPSDAPTKTWDKARTHIERQCALEARLIHPRIFSAPTMLLFLTKIAVEVDTQRGARICYVGCGEYRCSDLVAFADGQLAVDKLPYRDLVKRSSPSIAPDAFRPYV